MAIVLPKFPRRRASTADVIEKRPTLNLRCCREDGRYAAGDLLRCTWQIQNLADKEPQGLELSVLWYTEGKGDEDLTVHYFHRWSSSRLQELDLRVPQHFETQLPESPLSYNGHLFRIRWCIRMRLYLAGANGRSNSGGGLAASSSLTGGSGPIGSGIVVQMPFMVVSSLEPQPTETIQSVAQAALLTPSIR